MTFVLKMLARELRSSWRRLLFFFVCVAIGVGAIVAIRSVIQSVRTGLMSEARSIIASDVLISTNRPWTDEVLQRARTTAGDRRRARAHGRDRDGDDGESGTGRGCGPDGGAARRAAEVPVLRPRRSP